MVHRFRNMFMRRRICVYGNKSEQKRRYVSHMSDRKSSMKKHRPVDTTPLVMKIVRILCALVRINTCKCELAIIQIDGQYIACAVQRIPKTTALARAQ